MSRFAAGQRAGAFTAADDRRERRAVHRARIPDAVRAAPRGERARANRADARPASAACFPDAFTVIAPVAATRGACTPAAARMRRPAPARPSAAGGDSPGRAPGGGAPSTAATGYAAAARGWASGNEPAGDGSSVAPGNPAGPPACAARPEPGAARRGDAASGNEPRRGGAPSGEPPVADHAASDAAPGAPTGPNAAPVGCPVFLAGVPIDEAGARWLTATARAARAGEADAALALWLALRPRFVRWAAACLDRTSAADLRRDGAPWLLDDLLQEGYLVLLGVVADWPDRSDRAGAGAGAQSGAADGGMAGSVLAAGAPESNGPAGAVLPGAGSPADRAFLPWLFAVAPRRLSGALATLRDRAGRSPGDAVRAAPLADADLLADGTAEAAEAAARLAALAAALDPTDGALLLAHVVHREPIGLAGRRLGLDRGAAYHRWRRIRDRLRDELAT